MLKPLSRHPMKKNLKRTECYCVYKNKEPFQPTKLMKLPTKKKEVFYGILLKE